MENDELAKLGYVQSFCPDWIYSTCVITKAKIHYIFIEWLRGHPGGIKAISLSRDEWGMQKMIELYHSLAYEINSNDFVLNEWFIGCDDDNLEYMAPLLLATQTTHTDVQVTILPRNLPLHLLELDDVNNLDGYYSTKYSLFSKITNKGHRKLLIESCLAYEWCNESDN